MKQTILNWIPVMGWIICAALCFAMIAAFVHVSNSIPANAAPCQLSGMCQ